MVLWLPLFLTLADVIANVRVIIFRILCEMSQSEYSIRVVLPGVRLWMMISVVLYCFVFTNDLLNDWLYCCHDTSPTCATVLCNVNL